MKQKFRNYPLNATINDYENIRQSIIERFCSKLGILGIYEYGSVSTPGVSDLDLIFVLDEGASHIDEDYSLTEIGKFAQRLVEDGSIIKMQKVVFENILFLDHFNLKRLFGVDINIVRPSPTDIDLIKFASLMDWLPERVLKLHRIRNDSVLNINNALCVLHSLNYSFQSADFFVGKIEQKTALEADISNLRNAWNEFDNAENHLLNCIDHAIFIGLEYLKALDEYIGNTTLYLSRRFSMNSNTSLELYKNHFLEFNNSESFFTTIRWNSDRSINQYFLTLPHTFYPHFATLASVNGILGANIRKKMANYIPIPQGIVSKPYQTNLLRKINLAQVNAQFIKSQNLDTGLLRYGFHL